MRKLKIPVGQIHTSLFQRAIETGALMDFGDVRASADYTEGGLVVTPIENNRRGAALRKIAGTMPSAGTNIIVVTHKPNILDAFGKDLFDVHEGEASVFKPDGNGAYNNRPDPGRRLEQACADCKLNPEGTVAAQSRGRKIRASACTPLT
ncbi:MAG: hypothetical protein WBV66_07400 [Pseudolabrys sp.]